MNIDINEIEAKNSEEKYEYWLDIIQNITGSAQKQTEVARLLKGREKSKSYLVLMYVLMENEFSICSLSLKELLWGTIKDQNMDAYTRCASMSALSKCYPISKNAIEKLKDEKVKKAFLSLYDRYSS